MGKNRLEAFSDGVLAIIITIMVLEIKIPHGAEWSNLSSLLPIFLSYLLSFTFIAIYWGNHHHLLHTVKRVSTGILWSNTNLLFWLSLIPFATGWMGENHFSRNTVITYAVLQTLCGMSYHILQKMIQACHKTDEHLAKVYAAHERKGLISLVVYAVSIGVAFFNTFISGVLFFAVTALWIVPDKNIERAMKE
ncbi:MAG: TMEM175 family protein [Bacteroidota bacterium]